MQAKKKKKFTVVVAPDECKGCGRCVVACPRQVLVMSPDLNRFGLRFAAPVKDECIGCGSCFYACPEPGAVTVLEAEEKEGKA